MCVFLFFLLTAFGEETKIEDVYLLRVDQAATLGDRVLLAYHAPGVLPKTMLINMETETARDIVDQRIAAAMPILTPFGDGFAMISRFGTQYFFLLDINGQFLERLEPDQFDGWEEGLTLKRVYALSDGNLFCNLVSLRRKLDFVAILSPEKRALTIVHQEPTVTITQESAMTFSRRWVPGGDVVYLLTLEPGRIELLDPQTFQPVRTLYPGHHLIKRDPAKFKVLAKRRPYASRMGDPIIFGNEIAMSFFRDVDRFGEPLTPATEVGMHIDAEGRLHEGNTLYLSRFGKKILGFNISEKSLFVKKD